MLHWTESSHKLHATIGIGPPERRECEYTYPGANMDVRKSLSTNNCLSKKQFSHIYVCRWKFHRGRPLEENDKRVLRVAPHIVGKLAGPFLFTCLRP